MLLPPPNKFRRVPTIADYPSVASGTVTSGGWRLKGRSVKEESAPSVSIVTAVRNGASTLERALRSVWSQSHSGIEHIVVDGDSTDGTLDLVRSRSDDIAIWLSEPDAGISDAFNKGIALARGDIIGILNCDDWYEPGAIGAAVRALEQNQAEIVCGKLQYWHDDHRSYLVTSSPHLLETGMTVGHPTVFVRRSCYERLGIFRLDFRQAMDYEWLLRAKVSGARFCFVDRCLANMQDGGIGDRYWRKSQKEVALAREIHLPTARGVTAYWTHLGLALAKGSIRRTLEVVGMGGVRRVKHHIFSRGKIVPPKD